MTDTSISASGTIRFAATVVRVGGASPTNALYTSFIAAKSAARFKYTVTATAS
jgi:hypothetical protein